MLTNIQRGIYLQKIMVYLAYEAMDASKKRTWHTFGRKVIWTDRIAMKLDVSCILSAAYTKLLIDISKHIEKSPEKFGELMAWETDGYHHGVIRSSFNGHKKWSCTLQGSSFLKWMFIRNLSLTLFCNSRFETIHQNYLTNMETFST